MSETCVPGNTNNKELENVHGEPPKLLKDSDEHEANSRDAVRLNANDIFAENAVLRDADGLPERFRILRFGPGTLTLNGRQHPFEFQPEHAEMIVASAERKGQAIPMDCEHAGFLLAEAQGLEESDLAAQPLLGERTACGYVRLTREDDGLWAVVEQWAPRAAFLLKEKLYRYFSPVIRGLRDGHLRLSSLALTNSPALDQLEPLVARTETEAPTGAPELLELLSELFGLDSDSPAGTAVAWMAAELAELRELKTRTEGFLGKIRATLALKEDAGLELAEGRILVLTEQSKTAAGALKSLETELEVYRKDAATRQKEQLIEQGLRDGKLTPKLVADWANGQDAAALAEFLTNAPAIVPMGQLPLRQLPEYEELGASAQLAEIAANCGLDPAKVRENGRKAQNRT